MGDASWVRTIHESELAIVSVTGPRVRYEDACLTITILSATSQVSNLRYSAVLLIPRRYSYRQVYRRHKSLSCLTSAPASHGLGGFHV